MAIVVDRLRVVQTLMEKFDLKNYLEIGVHAAHIFFKVKSTFKVAVDPEFRFSKWKQITRTFTNPYNIYNRYFEKTSDAFFAEDAPRLFKDKPIQLAFIDGMHEYAFALRDIENSVKYLTDDGVIVLHDCNPATKEAEVSFEAWKQRNYVGSWNGDVWKSILHIRATRKDLTAFVLDTDEGVGVITKRPDNNPLQLTPQQISALTYADLEKNRKEYLNLQSWDYLYKYFNLEVPIGRPLR